MPKLPFFLVRYKNRVFGHQRSYKKRLNIVYHAHAYKAFTKDSLIIVHLIAIICHQFTLDDNNCSHDMQCVGWQAPPARQQHIVKAIEIQDRIQSMRA